MATTVSLNGSNYSIPRTGDDSWSNTGGVDDFLVALSTGVLQKAGGAFTLTAEVNFGGSFGLKSLYYKSTGANPATAGVVRLANAESLKWRNAANSADLALTVDASNNLNFNGTPIVTLSLGSANTALVMNSGGTGYQWAQIANANVSSSAAIAYSKLALTGSVVNADVASGAAIAYSKLALTGSVVNADIATGAAIAYSKLALTGSVVNADVSSSAAIAYSKLALTGSILNADLAGSIAYSKLTLTGSIVNADVSSSAAIAYSKLNLTTSVVNADIGASAAIAGTKISPDFGSQNVTTTGSVTGRTAKLTGSTSGTLTQQTAATTTDYTVTWPSAQGGASTVLTNDGSGGLSWGAGLSTSLNQYNTFIGNASNVATSTNTNLLGSVVAQTASQTATITIATPGVLTVTTAPATGATVYLTTSGALPTGLTASTTYYAINVSSTTLKLATSLANALDGTAITTSGSQSGTHTIFTGGLTVGANGVPGSTAGTAVPGGYVGEKAAFTTRSVTITAASTWYNNATPLVTLRPGVWLICGYWTLPAATANVYAAEICSSSSANTSNVLDSNGQAVSNSGNTVIVGLPPGIVVSSGSTSLYANALSFTNTSTSASVGGFAIRIA